MLHIWLLLILSNFTFTFSMFNNHSKYEKLKSSLIEKKTCDTKQKVTIRNFDIVPIDADKNGGLTEAEEEERDVAKALAMSKRFFWRNMVAKIDCSQEALGVGYHDAYHRQKVVNYCENFQALVNAIDAYVKSWECKRQEMVKSTGSDSINGKIISNCTVFFSNFFDKIFFSHSFGSCRSPARPAWRASFPPRSPTAPAG